MAPYQSTSAPEFSTSSPPDVIEVGLLLTAGRVNALIELSRKKRQSVSQILRGLIDRELLDLDRDGGDLADVGKDRDREAGASEARDFGTFV
jgi:hypothetical protein